MFATQSKHETDSWVEALKMTRCVCACVCVWRVVCVCMCEVSSLALGMCNRQWE